MEWLSDDVATVVGAGRSPIDPVLSDLAERAAASGFPIIGPDAGRVCRLLTRCLSGERAFEFGSGFGYSAAWIAPALAPGGELVCTEYDAERLAEARETLAGVDHDVRTRFVHGDAIEAFGETSGTFDVVLLDHEKDRYAEAFDIVRDRISTPGVVIADNVLDGPVEPESVRAALDGATDDANALGIARYLERVRDDDAFETVVLPVDEGIAVSLRS
jgi:predicted O-methyltransferase YrrM